MANPVPLFPKPEQFWRVFGERPYTSGWYDENGEQVGEWEVITLDEYEAIMAEHGGDDWQVFASNSGAREHGEIYTAWGIDGEDVPRVDHRCIYDPRVPDHVLTLPPPTRCVYRKFVRAAAVVRNQEEETDE